MQKKVLFSLFFLFHRGQVAVVEGVFQGPAEFFRFFQREPDIQDDDEVVLRRGVDDGFVFVNIRQLVDYLEGFAVRMGNAQRQAVELLRHFGWGNVYYFLYLYDLIIAVVV